MAQMGKLAPRKFPHMRTYEYEYEYIEPSDSGNRTGMGRLGMDPWLNRGEGGQHGKPLPTAACLLPALHRASDSLKKNPAE